MIQKLKRYKNLILLSAAVILLIALVASDPLGFCAQRAHDRAAIRNQMAIERAEADKQIAIIKAQTDTELKRIEMGFDLTGEQPTEQETELTESEPDTLQEDGQ